MVQTIYEIKAWIEQISRDKLPEYENIIGLLEENPMPDDAIKAVVKKAQKAYFFSVYKQVVEIYDSQTKMRLVHALDYPTAAGLPSKLNTDYFNENGMTGGVLFAMLNYSMGGSVPYSYEHAKIMKALDQFQVEQMQGVWTRKLAKTAPAPAAQESPKPAPEKMGQQFCRKCGHRLVEGYLFCNHCGTRIE